MIDTAEEIPTEKTYLWRRRSTIYDSHGPDHQGATGPYDIAFIVQAWGISILTTISISSVNTVSTADTILTTISIPIPILAASPASYLQHTPMSTDAPSPSASLPPSPTPSLSNTAGTWCCRHCIHRMFAAPCLHSWVAVLDRTRAFTSSIWLLGTISWRVFHSLCETSWRVPRTSSYREVNTFKALKHHSRHFHLHWPQSPSPSPSSFPCLHLSHLFHPQTWSDLHPHLNLPFPCLYLSHLSSAKRGISISIPNLHPHAYTYPISHPQTWSMEEASPSPIPIPMTIPIPSLIHKLD